MHSFGKPEGEDGLQCYLGLEDASNDIDKRLSIMGDAVNKAYEKSNKDTSVLKIFLAPEFFFRYKVRQYVEEDARARDMWSSPTSPLSDACELSWKFCVHHYLPLYYIMGQ